MKKCSKCGEIKPLSDFYNAKLNKDGKEGVCKKCRLVDRRRYYHTEDSSIKTRRKLNKQRKDISSKKYWVARKGGKCQDCQNKFPLCVYDFHHVDEKEMEPRDAMRLKRERQEKEMSKCILLCSNCHRIRHHGGGQQE